MRRFRLVPAMAILACLTMGADNPVPQAAAQEPAPPPIATPPLRKPEAPDSQAVRAWCSAEERGMLELATSLQNRSIALDERENLLKLRETELQDVEKRLLARMEDLKKLRADIGGQLDSADQQKESKVDELVKMVESNRASAISSMFEALDEDLAVQVLDRMNPSKAGKLLAAISPVRAARLAEKMANPIDPATLSTLEEPAAEAPTEAPTQPPAPTTPATPPAAQATPTPPPTATQ